LKTGELARIKKVNRNFSLYRLIEAGGIIAGIILILVFYKPPHQHFWLGLGISLAIMSAELFVADFIASKRALNYMNLLENFSGKTESMHP
jgi:hypothetical protein